MNKAEKELMRTLKKKAKGYTAEEVSEEYASEDGQLVLVKRKVTYKHVPPDISAAKIILEMSGAEPEDISAEELRREKSRLLRLLKEEEDNAAGKSKLQDQV